jgi:hypothetical protein
MMVKVLLLAANPEVPRLGLDTESREITQVFQLGTHRERFELHMRTDVRWQDLSQAIVALCPTVLHFSGHGHSGGIVLRDDVGGVAHDVPIDALAGLLANGFGVRVLLLNACNTAAHAQIFFASVDHVIAIDGAISDDGASIFAQGFYRTLACGHSVKTAFGAGVAELAARSPDRDDQKRPKYHVRPGATQELGEERPENADRLLAALVAVRARTNVFPLLPRALPDRLAEAFQDTNLVVDVIARADALVQQAGPELPELFRGHRLGVGRVPLQAGALHAWNSAIRDSAAISPYAVMAILLVAREQRPMLDVVDKAIVMIGSLS